MSKNFVSPSRPISRDQLNSVRQKFVRDSPNLYKQNILSYPKLEPHSSDSNTFTKTSSSQINDPLFNLRNLSLGNLSNNKNEAIPITQPSQTNVEELSHPIENDDTYQLTELGNFENPVLRKLLRRSVNKEQEFQTIITNIIGVSLWNLIINFITLFIEHSNTGKQLYCTLYKRLWSFKWLQIIYGNSYFKSLILGRLTWNHINYIFHLIICYNLIFAVWRLFSNGKTTDLKLTDKQKQLLGLKNYNDNNDTNNNGTNNKNSRIQFKFGNENINKPHIIQMNRPGQTLLHQNNTNVTVNDTPSTPFLFKSLKTPQKLRQEQHQQQQQSHFQPMNHTINKTNAFGDLRRTAVTNHYSNNNMNNGNPYATPSYNSMNNNNNNNNQNGHAAPMINKAYVASPKYSYLMNSPGPNHL
ncbi:similar to Saccharomyces cerevisiae YLR018C POM34 Integral membrane protein of the nuclear pore [Maudiozyma saulgeensis]|uniref:Similar to Saccharomyces cerevisiae YLR018C POM34 Integral membrane protein of the nuclear pore n=1 Tax=Maudiozyma saulgeensis TaxID=1789683 RepID=A0A1X7QZF5_9SACH|nr:similar to Saccharomyces cerevisiae YLR018C POM34 Integral membrane protein of the nuclear pore [Kazachstania saulgeensis]